MTQHALPPAELETSWHDPTALGEMENRMIAKDRGAAARAAERLFRKEAQARAGAVAWKEYTDHEEATRLKTAKYVPGAWRDAAAVELKGPFASSIPPDRKGQDVCVRATCIPTPLTVGGSRTLSGRWIGLLWNSSLVSFVGALVQSC